MAFKVNVLYSHSITCGKYIFKSRLNVYEHLPYPVFFLILLQIQMHCLPIQAKADHIHSLLDNSHYLGSGHIHHVSFRGDATSDQGANYSGFTGL